MNPASVMGATKREFFSFELVELRKIRLSLFSIYKEKNWGFIPSQIKKADLIMSKRITKISRLLKNENKKTGDEL